MTINDSHAIPPGDEAAAALARLGDAYAEPATAKACPHCGKTFHVEDEILPGEEFLDDEGDTWKAIVVDGELKLHYSDPTCEFLLTPDEARRDHGPLTRVALAPLADWERELLASTPRAKTHDLAVERRNGNVVITVQSEGEVDKHQVYLQEGVALDLGRVLAPLTPAQRKLLIDDLTGGES